LREANKFPISSGCNNKTGIKNTGTYFRKMYVGISMGEKNKEKQSGLLHYGSAL
jgi:hypothetical protein